MNLDSIIIAPIITEKSQSAQEIGKDIGKRTVKYTFKVHPDANKVMIKEAVKKIFQVTPSSVNVIMYHGKMKKFRNFPSRRPHWKKAIVTVADGEVIDFYSAI